MLNHLLVSGVLLIVMIQRYYPTMLSTIGFHFTETITPNDSSDTELFHSEFEFLSRYDNQVHERIHRLLHTFLKHYYVSLSKEVNLLYSNYYQHTHKIHKLEDLRGMILKEINNTVFLMSDYDFRFMHDIPTKLGRIEAYLTNKIKLLCLHLGMRYDNSRVESANIDTTIGNEF